MLLNHDQNTGPLNHPFNQFIGHYDDEDETIQNKHCRNFAVRTSCFLLSVAVSVVLTMWSSRKIFNEHEHVLFGLLSAKNYIYIATFAYAFDNFAKGADALSRSDTDTASATGCIATLAKIFPVGVAVMSSVAIIASCLDAKDSPIGDLISDNTQAKLAGGSLAFFACFGDFYARIKFGLSPATHNTNKIKNDFLNCGSIKGLVGQILKTLVVMPLASAAYSLFYQLYLFESLETYEKDFNIKYDLSDYQHYTAIITIFFAVGNNYLVTYEKISTILNAMMKKNFSLFFQITNKQGEPQPRNLLATVGQFIGAVDTFCTIYSGMRLTQGYQPALEWSLKAGMLFYAIGSYWGFSVNQGSALGLLRCENHIKAKCSARFFSQRKEETYKNGSSSRDYGDIEITYSDDDEEKEDSRPHYLFAAHT